MEGNFATRLKLFIESTGASTTQFADSCEIPRPSFSQLLSGRNQKVSDVIIRKIHFAFPDLSVAWLLFGEGNMLNSPICEISSDADDDEQKSGIDSKNPQILSDNPSIRKDSPENSNLVSLTSSENGINSAVIQQLEENKKIIELQMQIEKMQKNPRKVTQITVYYDDSTFDTFFPASR